MSEGYCFTIHFCFCRIDAWKVWDCVLIDLRSSHRTLGQSTRANDVPLSSPIDSHYPVNSSIALSLSALLPLLPLSTSNKHYPETGRPKQNANTYENLELSSRDLLSVIVDNAVTVHRAATRSRIDRTSTVTYISNPAQEGSANITKRWYQVFRE